MAARQKQAGVPRKNAVVLPVARWQIKSVIYSGASQHRKFWALIVVAAFAALTGFASDIKLLNGQIYKNATVLNRDGKTIDVMVSFGRMKISLQTVESIDGVPLHPTPTPKPAPSPAMSASVPAAEDHPQTSGTVAEQTAAPAAVPGAAISGTAGATPAATPLESSVPTPASVVATDEPPPKPKWPPYEYRLNMDFVLLGLAVISAIWIGTVGLVERDLFERRVDPRFWSNVAIAFPGLGCAFYFMARKIGKIVEKQKAAKSPQNVNETVAQRERRRTKEASRKRQGFEFLDEDRKAVLIKDKGAMSGIENAQDVLEEALLERASDVHIEPAEDEYRIRFRIDGIMHPRMTFERDDGQRLASALKTLAQIDVAEKRKAQDGRFRVRRGDNDVDFRVATANSIFGEKIVIRILDRKAGLLSLSDLGMSQSMKEEFARVIHSRSGMILATGPTGSGKTSTLYSALSQIDATRLNIMTIEDPVEYELTGATQVPVNVKAGVTYESGLRSLLRQDPDVIFVGEMRDIEAAQIALRAALTGHLLFSSLHTKDAIGTVIRLEEMGIERNQLASALLVLLAQRLVRVLCPACRVQSLCTGEELSEIGIDLPAGEPIFQAKGCEQCNDTGYVGRTGIFEMVVFDEDLRQAVNSGAGEQAFAEIARTKGYRSYREDGAEKILLGITSVEEILQAT